MSRLESSAKNIVFSFGSNILESLLGIVSRTIFISTLGAAYLGLAGLLGNILGFLSITELGIATAIGFSLYKPLAEKRYETVSAIMSLYRKVYCVISIVVLACGIGLFFFIDFFIPTEQQPPETKLAYFIFLTNTVLGYLLSYKTTLINSDNQTFRLAPINIAAVCIQFALQITCLITLKNYMAYLLVLMVCTVVRMIWQNLYITSIYPQVDFHSDAKMDAEITGQLKRNVGGLVISKIGDYLVNSTDNLIITKLVSLAATGIYSNYLLIRNMVNGYISLVFSGISASMGNVVAVESDARKLEIFDTLFFAAFAIYSFEAVCFMCLFNTFIGEVWIGKEYLFDTLTVAIIVINNYLTGLRIPLITMKGAAGKHMEDAWIPFAFAAINLISSVVLAKFMGVAGVFLGTILGSLLTADWYRPIVIYKHVLHAKVVLYFRKYVLYVLLGVVYMAISYWLCGFVATQYAIINLILKAIISILVPISATILLFGRTKEFKDILNMVCLLLSKALKKNKGV